MRIGRVRSLELRLKRLRLVGGLEAELGTGRPPENTEVRSIQDLELDGRRLEDLLVGGSGS